MGNGIQLRESAEKAITLVNAMSKKENLYVLVDDYPVPLPKVSAPILVSKTIQSGTQKIIVKNSVIDLAVVSETEASFTLGVPPVVDGVWYVVDPITKVNFPHREDFVIPHSFALWVTEAEWEERLGEYEGLRPKSRKKKQGKKEYKARGKKGSKKGSKKRGKKSRNIPKLSHPMRYPLVSVAVGRIAIASPGTTELFLEE